MLNKQQNIARAKAIEYKNKKRLLAVNPNFDEKSGIYSMTRVDESIERNI